MVAVAAIALVACSDDEEPDATAAATTTEAMTATASATEAMTATAAATETMTETPMATMEMMGTTVSVATEGDLAPYLVGPNGHTLYLFTNDEAGVSNCTDGCLANWPPLLVAAGEEPTAGEGVTGELGVIERADGVGRQVTYNGIPLYYWAADTAPGQTTGHEVGGVWFVVPPDETMASAPISGGSSNLPGY